MKNFVFFVLLFDKDFIFYFDGTQEGPSVVKKANRSAVQIWRYKFFHVFVTRKYNFPSVAKQRRLHSNGSSSDDGQS